MAVSCIGGGNRSTRRKPPTYRKSLTNLSQMFYRVHLAWAGFETTTLVVIGTDCIGSSKSNYHTITTTTAPLDIKNRNKRIYHMYPLVIHFVLSHLIKNWMHSFEVSLGYESIDRSTFSMKHGSASCWKCSSINAFIPEWNFKRMPSVLIIIFKSHQNLI